MNDFDALLGELETMAKGGAAAGGEGAGADEGAAAAAAAAAAATTTVAAAATVEGEPLKKSLTVKLEDGTEIEAEDGTELIKALTTRLDTTEGKLLKGLTAAVALIKSQGDALKAQSDQIATLTKSLEAMGSQGRGRKTMVAIHEQPAGAKGKEPEGITPAEFMTKALSSMNAGKLTGSELAVAESYVNRGLQVPAQLVAKVLS